MRGERLSLSVDGERVSVVVREIVAVSLRTKEQGEARRRFRDVSAQVERLYAASNSEALTLSHEETLLLAGQWYQSLIAQYRANPGAAEAWEIEFNKVAEALEHFVPDDDPDHQQRDRRPYNPELGERLVAEVLKPDLFLQERHLRLSPQSRLAFLREAGQAHMLACRQLGRYDRPDENAKRFPKEPFKRQPQSPAADIWALFEAWAAERKPRPSSLSGYRLSVSEFVASVGHTDASRYTKADVVKWKDEMVAAGRPAKTVNDTKLANLKAVLNFAARNDKVATNPAAGVSVEVPKKKMLGFNEHEVKALLSAAIADYRPVIRWVPLLCAMTGARVAEMMQLRREDVFLEEGVWSIRITPDAGGVKNETSERTIPLHPSLVKRGFLGFIGEKSAGPLFFNQDRTKSGAAAKPGKGATNHLREFVHDVAKREGLKIGRAHRKDPNHAWRHRFVTEARGHHMDPEKREYMIGHALPGQAEIYGGMRGLLTELVKLPDPLTGEHCDPALSRATQSD
jgi:integrase